MWTKIVKSNLQLLLLWLLSLLVPHSFCLEVVKRERHVIFESILGQKFHKLLPMIFIARVPENVEGASITVPI